MIRFRFVAVAVAALAVFGLGAGGVAAEPQREPPGDEKSLETLPEEERSYRHPHNDEILSGQLVAPGVPAVAEERLMRGKMNSYGKTWHFWSAGVFEREDDPLPLGEPMLAWSFNRDGEALPGLIAARDERLGLSTAETREGRRELAPLAKPQRGVDAIAEAFPAAEGAPEGVRTKEGGAR